MSFNPTKTQWKQSSVPIRVWPLAILALLICTSFAATAQPADSAPKPQQAKEQAPDESPNSDRPRRGDRRFRTPMREIELTDEQTDALLAFLEEQNVSLAEQLATLRETDPQKFEQAIKRVVESERMRPILMMMRYDPEGANLRLKVMAAQAHAGRLRRQIGRDGQAPTPQMTEDLHQAVTTIVDAELKLREHELVQLEKRLAYLREELVNRKANRNELIERYQRDLLEGRNRFGRPGGPRPAEPGE